MKLFGLGSAEGVGIGCFEISTPVVKVGNALEFGFDLSNNSTEKTKIRLEYAIYYRKANGALAKKVYKISEKEYAGNFTKRITRKHSFKVVTTRKLHAGLHQVAVIINGKEFERHDFELME